MNGKTLLLALNAATVMMMGAGQAQDAGFNGIPGVFTTGFGP